MTESPNSRWSLEELVYILEPRIRQRSLEEDAEIDAAYAQNLYQMLRSLRLRLGLSQAALAAITGDRQSEISPRERGISDPQLSTIARHAAGLGCRLDISLVPDPHLIRYPEAVMIKNEMNWEGQEVVNYGCHTTLPSPEDADAVLAIWMKNLRPDMELA